MESGDKLEDCVEYIRVKIYNLLVKPHGKTDDCDSGSKTDEIPESEKINTENGSITEKDMLNNDKDTSIDVEDVSEKILMINLVKKKIRRFQLTIFFILFLFSSCKDLLLRKMIDYLYS